MKKKLVVCLELQRGQVSYEKIGKRNRVQGKIGRCYNNNNKIKPADRTKKKGSIEL